MPIGPWCLREIEIDPWCLRGIEGSKAKLHPHRAPTGQVNASKAAPPGPPASQGGGAQGHRVLWVASWLALAGEHPGKVGGRYGQLLREV